MTKFQHKYHFIKSERERETNYDVTQQKLKLLRN